MNNTKLDIIIRIYNECKPCEKTRLENPKHQEELLKDLQNIWLVNFFTTEPVEDYMLEYARESYDRFVFYRRKKTATAYYSAWTVALTRQQVKKCYQEKLIDETDFETVRKIYNQREY